MSSFRNVMECLVISKLDEIWSSLDNCKCEKCREDIIACALNQLPPKYVVSSEGELYIRAEKLVAEHEFEILLAIAKAIKIVSENPKHTNCICNC